MKTNIRYILLTALRDWLFAGLLLGVCFAVLISSAMGDMAMVEPERLKVVYAAASCRMLLVLGLIVFVCFHVRQAFDNKEIDVFLSRPISRPNLVLSYWLGFATAALLLIVPTLAILWLVGAADINLVGFWAWAGTFFLEGMLVVAVALFCSFTLKSGVTSVLAAFGFYILSRMMGFFIATSQSSLLFNSREVNELSRTLMEYLAIVVPRLDFFAKTEWLIYGSQSDSMSMIWLPLIQAAIFIPLLLAAATIDFKRKQF